MAHPSRRARNILSPRGSFTSAAAAAAARRGMRGRGRAGGRGMVVASAGRGEENPFIANAESLRVTNTELTRHVTTLRKRQWELERVNRGLKERVEALEQGQAEESRRVRAAIQEGFLQSRLSSLSLDPEERKERDQSGQDALDAIRSEYQGREERLRAVLAGLVEAAGPELEQGVERVLEVARELRLVGG